MFSVKHSRALCIAYVGFSAVVQHGSFSRGDGMLLHLSFLNPIQGGGAHCAPPCCVLTLLVENRTEPEMGSRSELLLFISERKVGYTHPRKWRLASIE